jgi:formate hydrogenlyase transcriptional activator
MAGPELNHAADVHASERAEELFRAIFAGAPDPIVILDSDRTFLDVNPAACESLGFSRQALVGHKVEEFVDEVNLRDLEFLWRELLREGFQRGEFRFRRGDGTYRSFDHFTKANFLPDRHISILRDITSRQSIEAALRESNERFRLLVADLKDYAIFMTDTAGRIVSWNAGAERMLGYRAEEILGKNLTVFYTREDIENGVPQKLIAEAGSKGRLEAEGWPVRKDGTRFWASFVLTALRDEKGELRGYAKVTRDMSERRAALEALEEGEQRFHSVLDASPSVVFIKDTEGRYIYVNPQFEKLCELPASQVPGKTDFEIFPAAQAEVFVANDRKVFEAQAPMVFEEVARQDDGLHTSVVNKFPLLDTKGKIYAVCGTVTDITAHKRAEATIQLLLEISEKLNSTLDVDQLMEYLVLGAIKLVDAESGYSGLRSADGLACHNHFLGESPVPLDFSWPPGKGLPGWLLVHKVPYLTNDAANDAQCLREIRERFGIRSALSVPILDARGEVIGFFQVHNKKDNLGFTPSDREHAMAVSQIASIAIQNALAYRQLAEIKDKLAVEKLYLENELRTQYGFPELVGESSGLKSILKQIETVAPTDATVLILGETGTGKELIARAIHNLSPRRERTFVKLNCAAIPTGLLESELFGYERGAFTGALSQKIGRLELAHHGTLFLDEVGDIPLELQPKLLRALQEKEFERLGSTRTIPVDLRLIAATNRDLGQMVRDREFRSDLYYRLNVFPVFVPPLRARPADIPLLTRHFVEKSAHRLNKHIDTIPARTVEALAKWHWPGNVRELENFIERAVILTEGTSLQVPLAELTPSDEAGRPAPISLDDAEREHILKALRESGGVVGGAHGAAARLGIKRTTLNSKMRKLKITRRDV